MAKFIKGFHLESALRMPYRPFGPNRQVSVFSYGASALGGVFHDINEDEAIETVRLAIRSGVNLVDTAPWYGFGKSEEVLGRALKGIPREAYYLHTKVGRYDPDIVKRFDFSYERILKSVDESLARLGVDYIDTIQVHDPEFAPSLDIIHQETFPALVEAVRLGKARSIGITGYPLDVLRKLADTAKVPIASAISYSHHTLHDRSLVDSGLLHHLKSKGIGVINASPLSMGLLTARGPPEWHPASPALKTRTKQAAEYAARKGTDISRLSLAFCFEDPAVPTVMGSASDRATLQANLDLATGVNPLTPAEREVMTHIVHEYFTPHSQGAHAQTHGMSDDPHAASPHARWQSWEGREVEKYWVKLGKTLVEQEYARKAAARKGGAKLQ